MKNGALDYTLEPACRRRVDLAFDTQAFQFSVQVSDNDVRKLAHIDTAGLHNLSCIGIVYQRQKEMLERRIFMRPVASMFQGVVKGCFQRLRK